MSRPTEAEISRVMAELGRRGNRALKSAGAKAQAQRMTKKQLKARASKAGKAGAAARWGKREDSESCPHCAVRGCEGECQERL